MTADASKLLQDLEDRVKRLVDHLTVVTRERDEALVRLGELEPLREEQAGLLARVEAMLTLIDESGLAPEEP